MLFLSIYEMRHKILSLPSWCFYIFYLSTAKEIHSQSSDKKKGYKIL